MLRRFPAAAAAAALTLVLAHAAPAAEVASLAPAPSVSLVDKALLEEVRAFARAPVSLIAINAQNKRHRSLSAADIDRLDKQWRAERKSDRQPLIAQLFGSPLSTYLMRLKSNSNGLFTEVFVMDNRGLNVGTSSITSDYWQGDEAKWQKTYAVGPGAVFIDEPEYDEDARIHRVQINMTIEDPQSGKPIGAITAEVNLNELARRRGF